MIQIKAMRKARGMTAKDLSELCGCSRALITMIENREVTPTVRIAKKLGMIFNFNWWLLYDD